MTASPLVIPGDLHVSGSLRVGGTLPTIPRSSLEQTVLAEYCIPWYAWRIWDAIQTNLPGTSSGDDLGLVGGTFGSASPSLQTADLKAAGATSVRARTMLWLPPEYEGGQTVQLRFHAGMLTTIADVAATIDAEAYKSNGEAGIGSNLVTTAAITINSLTLADKTFTVDASGLLPGDWLDLRVTLAVNDSATATAVKGIIGEAFLLLDIKG